MRNLASIQRILAIDPIPEADAIEVATILGWKVVVRKEEFQVGDLCVYCEIDSLLPEREEFEFLRKSKFRIKTVRLRGQLSQGICFSLNILPPGLQAYGKEGQNVTDILDVKKYEPPVPVCLRGQVKGLFPGFLRKTDETRIQSAIGLLEELRGREVYITVKVDGTSGTFSFHEGEFDVCSRNMSLKETEGNIFWRMFHKYKLGDILRSYGRDIAIQGEVAGPGIQKNRLGLDEHELFVFDAYDIVGGRYFDGLELRDFCTANNLQRVPMLDEGVTLNPDLTLEELLKMAEGKYDSGHYREGIVIRPMVETYSRALNSRMSCKVVNNTYLLKGGD
ncbi:MAG: RNA ligase (ATP) [Candidatus Odinarchaeota archaeon]